MSSKIQQLIRWLFTLEPLEVTEPKLTGDKHPSPWRGVFRLEPLEVLPEEQPPAAPSALRWIFGADPLPRDAEEAHPPRGVPLLRWLFWVEPLAREEEAPKHKSLPVLSWLFSPEKLPPGGE